MAVKTEHLTRQLRAARESQKLSQRTLGARSGLTQSHISQIERGMMEPGLASLVDVARALDLEIVLAPRKLMPAIRTILAQTSPDAPTVEQRRLGDRIARWPASFGQDGAAAPEAEALRESLALLRHLPLSSEALDRLREIADGIDPAPADPPAGRDVGRVAHAVGQLRTAALHRDRDDAMPRSAYSLEEADDDA